MIPVVVPRFDLHKCNGELERELIEALYARAEAGDWYVESWPRAGHIILSTDIFIDDPTYKRLLRTLKVDFDGTTVMDLRAM